VYAWLSRHPRLVDAVPAFWLALLGVATVKLKRGGSTVAYGPSGVVHTTASYGDRHVLIVLLPLVAAMVIPVVFRRTYPVQAFAVAAVAGAIQVLTYSLPLGSDLAILILLYSLAAYRPRRVSVLGLGVCLAGAVVAVAVWVPSSVSPLNRVLLATVIFSGTALVAWVLGDSMRYRRAYLTSLEDRAARLERERDAQAQISAAAERARIARELHDVVAHNVSVMVVQADGASYALRSEPDRTAQALTAISQTGRQALAEMRRLLGILRSGDEAGDLAPVPGLDQLRELLDQARKAGMSVSLTLEGAARPVPEGAELAAYRVVQESLTNTRKHGGLAAAAAVILRYEPDGLMLRVTDDGLAAAGPGTGPAADEPGHGLTGMRERIEMYGGTIQAGPLPGGGWQVTARLPGTAAPDDHPHNGLERPGRSRRALDGAALASRRGAGNAT
jgi:signal transduction histidine kinase